MINIDWDQLCEAIGDYTKTHHYFLNKKTGDILVLSEYMSEGSKSEIKKRIRNTKITDYVLIPVIDSREGYKMMEEFTEKMGDKKVKKQLMEALSEEAPFKKFKEIVYNHPEERKRWLDFRQKKLLERAKAWCKQIGVI